MRTSIRAVIGGAGALLGVLAAACVSGRHPAPPPALSSAFYGAWANAGPQAHNWWEISDSEVVIYRIDSAGKCESAHGVVLDPEQAEVQFGTADTVTLHRQGDLLFVATEGQVGINQRVESATICRKADGTYAEGAPHAAATR